MPVLIDTNVISDILHADPVWELWSETMIVQYFGELIINPIIYAELSCRASSSQELDEILNPFNLTYLDLPKEALFLASQAFLAYRRRGGTKSSPLPDFFIGAHASVLNIPILTRDTARYKTYFPDLTIISPE